MKKFAVGVDIGGTNTAFGLVDEQGKIIGESNMSTKQYPDIDRYIEDMYLGVQSLIKSFDFPVELAGVGIGAPNANFYSGKIESSPNLPWKGNVPIADKVRRYFPSVPVIVTNDAKAAAIGEMTYGGARGMRDFITITLGTGLGSGFVAAGRVIHGHDGMAGELGHVTVNHTGRVCGCGRKGCLETYVSATGIKRTIFKLLADHTEASEFRSVTYDNLSAEMITRAALNGDPLAIEAYEYTGMMLGRALANAVAITSPEAIFLMGGLAKAGKYLFEPVKKYMELNLLQVFRDNVKLLPSSLDDKYAAILGASSLVWKEL